MSHSIPTRRISSESCIQERARPVLFMAVTFASSPTKYIYCGLRVRMTKMKWGGAGRGGVGLSRILT